MCSKEEQSVMVKAIRKAGWVRSSLAAVLTVVALITGLWTLGGNIRGGVVDLVDEKIEVHRLKTSMEISEKFHEIQLQQQRVEDKVDTILERLPE